jgi:hypothetical protein
MSKGGRNYKHGEKGDSKSSKMSKQSKLSKMSKMSGIISVAPVLTRQRTNQHMHSQSQPEIIADQGAILSVRASR